MSKHPTEHLEAAEAFRRALSGYKDVWQAITDAFLAGIDYARLTAPPSKPKSFTDTPTPAGDGFTQDLKAALLATEAERQQSKDFVFEGPGAYQAGRRLDGPPAITMADLVVRLDALDKAHSWQQGATDARVDKLAAGIDAVSAALAKLQEVADWGELEARVDRLASAVDEMPALMNEHQSASFQRFGKLRLDTCEKFEEHDARLVKVETECGLPIKTKHVAPDGKVSYTHESRPLGQAGKLALRLVLPSEHLSELRRFDRHRLDGR